MSEPSQTSGRSLAWRRRIVGACVAAPFLAMIVTAYSVAPRSRGYGTAGDWGVPDCSYLARSGYPCPACGLTTSVSAMARGRIGFAFRAHPFGVFLFPAAVILAGMGGFQAISGDNVLGRLRLRWWHLAVVFGLLMAGWIWVREAGVADGRWPID